MENFMYFIKIDDNIIKYGISSNICSRIYAHYNKFVKQMKLKEDLEILHIIGFKNKILNKETERRLKNYIKCNDKYFKGYNETELFYLDEYDFYIKKIYKFIENIIDEYDIDENEYADLKNDEINLIYDNIKKGNRINNNTDYKSNYYEKICPRCGQTFNKKCNLNVHLKKKIICEAKYINVIQEELIKNYNMYYNDYYMRYKYQYMEKKLARYCFRCGKEFTTKSNLNQHLNRKNKCTITYLNISCESVRNEYKKYENIFITVLSNTKPTQEVTQTNTVNENEVTQTNTKNEMKVGIECEYCGVKLNHKNSYYRHKKYYCNVKKKEELMNEYLETKYNLLKMDYDEKINKIKEEKDEEIALVKHALEDKIKELEEKINDQIVPQHQQNIQNAENVQSAETINNGTVNNVTIINNYGEEDLSSITKEKCEEIMAHEFDMLVKFVEYVHITLEENRNIFVPSTKEGFVMTLQGQTWNLLDKKTCITDLMNKNNIELEKLLEKYGAEFEKISHKRTDQIIKLCGTDDEEREKIKKDLMLLLFNSRKMVQQTFERIYGIKIGGR